MFKDTLLSGAFRNSFLLAPESAPPFVMIAKVEGGKAAELPGLPDIAFHEPCLCQVIVIPPICRMKVDGSFEGSNGLVGLVALKKHPGLLHELQGGETGRARSRHDLILFLFLSNRFRGRKRGWRCGALRQWEPQEGYKKNLRNS